MNRLAALHACPAFSSALRRPARRRRQTSSVPSRMNGSEPPSSSTTFLRLRPAICSDRGAGALGAGHRHAADTRVGDHPLDLLVGRVDVLVAALGVARVLEDLRDRRGRFGALRSVFEQDRVADHVVGTGEAGDLVVGVVPGHDPEQHAVGAAADDRGALAPEQLDRFVCHQALGVLGVELVDHAGELGLADGLLDRLAHLAHDDLAELLLALGVEPADGADQLRPLGDGRALAPGAVRAIGSGDRVGELGVGDLRVLLDDLVGGRVDHCVAAHVSPSSRIGVIVCAGVVRPAAHARAGSSSASATAGCLISPSLTFRPLRQPGVLGESLRHPALGELDHVRQRRVRERVGRGDRHRAGHVRHAVVGDAVDLVGRVRMGRRARGLKAAALVDRHVDEHRVALHQLRAARA